MSDALVPTPSLPARRARLPPPRLQWSRRPGARLPPLRRRRGPPARPPRGAPSLPHRGGGRARVARRPDPSRGDGRGPGRVRRGARGVRQGGAAGAVGPHLLPGGRAGRAHGQPRPRGRLPDREPRRSAEPRGAGRPGRPPQRRVARHVAPLPHAARVGLPLADRRRHPAGPRRARSRHGGRHALHLADRGGRAGPRHGSRAGARLGARRRRLLRRRHRRGGGDPGPGRHAGRAGADRLPPSSRPPAHRRGPGAPVPRGPARPEPPLRRSHRAPRGSRLPARPPARPRRAQGRGVAQHRGLQPPPSLRGPGRRGGGLPAGHRSGRGVLLAPGQSRPPLHGHGGARARRRVAGGRDPHRSQALPGVGEPGPGFLLPPALRGRGARLSCRPRHQSEGRGGPRLSRPQPAEPRPRRRGRAPSCRPRSGSTRASPRSAISSAGAWRPIRAPSNRTDTAVWWGALCAPIPRPPPACRRTARSR